MFKPKSLLTTAAIAALAAVCSLQNLKATPYASSLTNNSGTISFRLNEAASSVAIVYTNLTGDTIITNLGNKVAGLIVTNLGIPANFTVAVTNSGAAGYLGGATLQISNDSTNSGTTNSLRFNAPRGIAVNKNPASPYFGRIYVANALAGTATRPVQDGIYILNADYSDAVGQSTNARTGGITAFTNNIPGSADDGNTPWHLEVGEDDQLYISDFSTTNGNIYTTDPNVLVGTNVLVGFGAPGTPNASPHHGRIGSSVIAQGSLANGNLTIYALDSDIAYNGGGTGPGANHIVKWEIGAGPLPVDLAVTNVDNDTLLPDAGVTVDLDRGPDGKFYTMQNRSAGAEGGLFVVDPAVDGGVFDPTPDGLWDEVFDSRSATIVLNGLVQTNDLLLTSRAVKVSPDGQYIALIRDDNQIWVINLVSGIPDLTTAKLIATTPTTVIGRDIAFDAAGNILTVSSGQAVARVYSPGYKTVTQTSSQGTFSVTNIVPADTVTMTVTDANAAEPGGLGGDTGNFNFTRTGDASQPLTVNYAISGTATRGLDYVTNGASGAIAVINGAVTFGAGETSTNVTIDVIDDNFAEAPETVIFTLSANSNYFSGPPLSGTVTIADDGDVPSISVTNVGSGSYELIPGRPAKFKITSPLAYTVPLTVNVSLSGTAVSGVDYTNPATFTVNYPAGTTTTNFTVTPLGNSLTTNKTIIATVLAGSGYVPAAPLIATNILRADFLAPTTPLFSDNFDTDTTANWVTNAFTADNDVVFNYDYSLDGVPPAPHSPGSTRGLRLRAHLGPQGAATGISVSPIGLSLPANYRLRFDLWMNYNGPAPGGGTGSSEYFTAGVGVSETRTNIAGQSAGTPIAAWGNPAGSCVIFAADGDGGFAESTGDYIVYSNNVAITGNTNVYPAGVRSHAGIYYGEFGEITPPAAQTTLFPTSQTGSDFLGSLAFSWHDVVITKQGTNITWDIDGLRMANTSYAPAFIGSNFSLGYEDLNGSITSVPRMNSAIVDNLTVQSLPVVGQGPSITAIVLINSGASVQVDFSGNAADAATDYVLQSSATVQGPYVDISSVNTSTGTGTFRAVAPVSGDAQFYRIKR